MEKLLVGLQVRIIQIHMSIAADVQQNWELRQIIEFCLFLKILVWNEEEEIFMEEVLTTLLSKFRFPIFILILK